MPTQEKPLKIEITFKTIVFTVLFLLSLKLLWMLRGLLVSLFIAFMIMSIVKPLVVRLERRRIPRTLSALVIYIILIYLLGYGLFLLLPSLLLDMTSFIRTIISLINDIPPPYSEYVQLNSLSRYIPNLTNQVFNILGGVFSNIVFVITTLFFSFYFIVDEKFTQRFLAKFLPEKRVTEVVAVLDRCEKRMSNWFWGELILMTLIGSLTFLGLTLIGVPHALSLAVIAGLLEIVPVVGPIIAAIPAFIFAVNQSMFLGLWTLALYIIIQQLENNLIVPAVMKRVVGLNKIIILMVLIIGGKLGGFAGIFLAVPLTLFIETVLAEIMRERKA